MVNQPCEQANKVFRKEFSESSLRRLYLEYIDKTAAIGLDGVSRDIFARHLSSNIRVISKKVLSGTYNFTAYKEKLISKGPAKYPRIISIATFRDRLVLRAILSVLQKVFCEVKQEIPQTKIARVKEALLNGDFQTFIKLDVENFYPSINHELMMKMLGRKIRTKNLKNLIVKSLRSPTTSSPPAREDNKKGIPQGLSISNQMAEIYLLDFDKEMKEKAGIFYERYVDDILIFCNSRDAQMVSEEAINSLNRLGLKAHRPGVDESKSKIGSIDESFSFLGYVFTCKKASIRSASIRRFESSIASILTTNKYRKKPNYEVLEWRLNLRITGCVFDNKRLGWLFYFSQIDDVQLAHMVDSTIYKLLKRFDVHDKVKLKRMVKVFHEVRRTSLSSHRYIPNFDLMNTDEKREILGKYFGYERISSLDPDRVERFFAMRISKVAKELEKDILQFS